MENVGSIEYDAKINSSQLSKDSAEVDAIAKRTGDSLDKGITGGTDKANAAFANFKQVATVALVAAGAAVVAFGVSSVQAYEEAQAAQSQTEAVLKSTAGAAGVTARQVTDLATAFESVTPYADEVIQSAENMLLTFTNIGKDVFPQTTQAVLDMSTAMGTDLKSTAIQVGKALQDPVLGATALQRVGVRLTESQKDLIKSLVEVGDTAGAQSIILKELQTEFGGSATAAGSTFAGQLTILKNRLGNVQEGIGQAIAQGIMPWVTSSLNWFDSIGGVNGAMAALNGTVTTASNTFMTYLPAISGLATAMVAYNTIVGVAAISQGALNAVMALNPYVAGTAAIIGLSVAFATLVASSDLSKSAAERLTTAKDNLKIAMDNVTGTAITEHQANLNAIIAEETKAAAIQHATDMLNQYGKDSPQYIKAQAEANVATDTATTKQGLLKDAIKASKDAITEVPKVEAVVKELKKIEDAGYNGAAAWRKQNEDFGVLKTNLNNFNGSTFSYNISGKNTGDSIPHKAAGGAVSSNTPYFVGDNPDGSLNSTSELFVPRTSGTIVNSKDLQGMIGGSSKVVNNNISLNLSGIMTASPADERALAKRLIDRLNEQLRANGKTELAI